MRDAWPIAFAAILEKEGGWDNNPADSGGPTLSGYTYNEYCAFHGLPQCEDRNWDPAIVAKLRRVTRDELSKYYMARKWTPIRGDDLPPGIDLIAVDSATLFGIKQATLFLQRSLGRPDTGHLNDDDVAAANGADIPSVVDNIAEQRSSFCVTLAERRPKDREFLHGWQNRTAQVCIEAKEHACRLSQVRLNELGYRAGAEDGDHGAITRSAVLTFQDQHNLPVTGVIDPATRDTLHSPDAKRFPLPESRANATSDDLADLGSTDVRDARAQKTAAQVMAGGSILATIDHFFNGGAIDGLLATADKATSLMSRVGLPSSSSQSQRVFLYIAGFAFASWLWHLAHSREARRVLKHQLGLDLSR